MFTLPTEARPIFVQKLEGDGLKQLAARQQETAQPATAAAAAAAPANAAVNAQVTTQK